MHDWDRTILSGGIPQERESFFDDNAVFDEAAEVFPEAVDDAEFDSDLLGELEFESPSTRVFSDEEEEALAAELLDVANEKELESFLASTMALSAEIEAEHDELDFESRRQRRRRRRRRRRARRRRLFRRLGGALKGLAGTALRGVGTAFGGPAGGAAAGAIGRVFGLELEGLSSEDASFEVARRFVRLVGESTQGALDAPDGVEDNEAVASAIRAAVARNAPGLTKRFGRQDSPIASSGRWVRRGSRIILIGA